MTGAKTSAAHVALLHWVRHRAIALVVLAALQAACVRHAAPAPRPARPSLPARPDFIDMEAGMQVRVVAPMLRSGGYVLPSLRTEAQGNPMNIETGEDFLGYEKAFYKVTPRRGGGIRIRFSHAEVWEKGKTYRRNKPLIPIFGPAADARYVRLVFLTRVSQADHDMAIVSSNDVAALDEVTRAITQRAECSSSPAATCAWVPRGVAVTPERG